MDGLDLLALPQSEIIELSKVPLFQRYSRSAVIRWILRGKLQAAKLGGKWLTTHQAIRDFLASCQPDRTVNSDPKSKAIEREKAFLCAKLKLQASSGFRKKTGPK